MSPRKVTPCSALPLWSSGVWDRGRRSYFMPEPPKNTEFVEFRVFRMPCCSQQLCWVNPRTPNFCPECGTRVLTKLRSGEFTLFVDKNAYIRHNK